MTHSAQDLLGIVEAVKRNASRVIRSAREKGQTGGYFEFALKGKDPNNRILAGKWLVGRLSAIDAINSCAYVDNKIEALAANPTVISSYLMRAPASGLYGGGIRTKRGWIAFSGLKEYMDEAVCLLVALEFNWISLERALDIVEASNNTFAKRLIMHTPALPFTG